MALGVHLFDSHQTQSAHYLQSESFTSSDTAGLCPPGRSCQASRQTCHDRTEPPAAVDLAALHCCPSSGRRALCEQGVERVKTVVFDERITSVQPSVIPCRQHRLTSARTYSHLQHYVIVPWDTDFTLQKSIHERLS